ncbi:MAG: hypothetical protein EOO70_07345 [Myxococcaceae bacterium]|nr:MAG: hypothetical protein EOO70_07345 [Myxococcaceae bacterium]
MMRGVETIGAVAERRRERGVFALETLGAFDGVALVVVELCDEAFERAPEGYDVCAGVRVGIVGLEAQAAGDAGEFAGAVVDQEIELAVRVEHGGGYCSAVGEIGAEACQFIVFGEDLEAELDDVMQIHLQRLYGAEAPEELQDDLPERFHGLSIRALGGS